MLRLCTFGGINVVGDDGTPVCGATTQRRPLALVAIIAESGQRGITRDKLLGLLWPDVDAVRARHSLTQGLYAARRAFGVDDLFVNDGSLRLNPDRIISDVGDFERALVDGDLEAAVCLYNGPFLDGFFVSGASEFDQWVSARRTEFEDRAVSALDRLAAAAELSRETVRAVEYRKRVASIRPLDSTAAARLVTLLITIGNRGEALREARRHEMTLRDQLDLAPDATFAALVRQLRDRPIPIGSSRDNEGPPPTRGADVRDDEANLIGAPFDLAKRRFVRRPRSRMIAAAGVAAFLIGGWAFHSILGTIARRRPSALSRGAPASFFVAPFNISAASPSTKYLGAAVVELLAPRLSFDSSARPVDAGSVLAAWRSKRFDQMQDVPRDSVLDLAASVAADRVVLGSVVGTRARTVLTAAIASVSTGTTGATASVEGPADSITTLVDQLAAKLLALEFGESEQLAAQWSHSPLAFRRLLAGRIADYRGNYAHAAREYASALAADSTFSTAALRLAVAADRLGNAELETDAVARAWANRAALNERERALLLAFAGPRYPQASTVAEEFAAWSAVVRRAPKSAEAWYHLAVRLLREGDRLGSATTSGQTVVALNRAVALDARYMPAQRLLSLARQHAGDSVVTEPLATRVDDMTDVRTSAMSSLWNARRLEEAGRAIDILVASATTTAEAVDAVLAEHSLALNQGRSADALASTRRLHGLRPDSHAHLRLRVLDALYGDGDSAIAAAAAAELARTVGASPLAELPLEGRRRAADGCVLGQWKLAHEDTSGVQAVISTLRGRVGRHEAQLVTTLPDVCSELLETALAVATKQSSAFAHLERLDSLVLTSAVAGNAAGYAHILISRMYQRLGHLHRALNAIRRHDYMLGWPDYLATTWREEWRLADALGDERSATAARRRYTALRASPRS